MPRPSWDKYFMQIAHDVATRSTCLSRQVGAVIVKDKQILTTGYNGAPRGLMHCAQYGCIRPDADPGEHLDLCRGLHAEMNAIAQAAVHGASVAGGTIYCTTPPCLLCSKMIINAGIKCVFVEGEYPNSLATNLLDEVDIQMVYLKED